MWIFCDLRSSFSSPAGTKKNTKQWTKCPLVLYVKPSNERFIIPLQRKNCYLQLASIFLVRVFKNVLIPSVRMTLTMSKMFTRIIRQTIEWDVNYSTAKRKKYICIYYFGFYFLVRVSKTSYGSVRVPPFESGGIRPVENRLNQDTTVYYGLVFCAFSWPYMAKDIIVE